MGKEKPKVQTIIEAVFAGAVDKLVKANCGQLIEALYVYLDMKTGEILVYDENENLLEKNIIFEWAERAEKGVRLYKQAVHFVRVVLASLKGRKIFDNPVFMRPFKVSVVDDGFNEIENVLTLEGADVIVEGRLMKNLEQDLKNFYAKIFAE